jgi:putative transposase
LVSALLRRKEVGRDRLFALLGKNELLFAPKKNGRTTSHDPSLPVYPNLLDQLEPTQLNQVWVSDITYVAAEDGIPFTRSAWLFS